MLSSIDQNLSSLREAFDRLGDVASRVARDGATGDVAGNLVDLSRVRAQVRVNVIALRTAEETVGSLLDIFV